jgi:hypothetical protein
VLALSGMRAKDLTGVIHTPTLAQIARRVAVNA